MVRTVFILCLFTPLPVVQQWLDLKPGSTRSIASRKRTSYAVIYTNLAYRLSSRFSFYAERRTTISDVSSDVALVLHITGRPKIHTVILSTCDNCIATARGS
ncbi:hypothetical protein BDY19DRAFT_972214 [Irpex rosettiformis]|uniref:Uncharacterized protein n=1 Tax=Irpex rosettiformis TaxID=378272 RepID=A0ACB8TQS5_9APHY|nr:hypothetical protein BDY19DRAFT_972214 [Irpex rosettiformis]